MVENSKRTKRLVFLKDYEEDNFYEPVNNEWKKT